MELLTKHQNLTWEVRKFCGRIEENKPKLYLVQLQAYTVPLIRKQNLISFYKPYPYNPTTGDRP